MDNIQLPNLLALVIALAIMQLGVDAQGGMCEIELNPLKLKNFNMPLLVHPTSRELIHPVLKNGKIIINMNNGDQIIAACSRKNNHFKKYVSSHALDVSCQASKLIVLNQVVQWTDLECQDKQRANLRNMKTQCGNQGVYYQIGWNIDPQFFINHINVCFDPSLETTQFVSHKLQGNIIGVKPASGVRPGFVNDGLFTVDIETAYTKQSQISLLNSLLGPNTVYGKGQLFMVKGHLTPDADFFYKAENDATYFYANAVPQWQCSNNCNWKRLENDVRALADKHQITFEIWTGSYGLLQLPNANNNNIDVLLGLREKKRKVPVPAVMWKVIQNPQTGDAVAIVSVNEVTGKGHSNDISLYASPCQDVCKNLTWINSLRAHVHDVKRGLIFCCEVNDLKSKIPYLPNLGRVGLLTN